MSQVIASAYDLKPGAIVEFIYNDKPRRVQVERVATSKAKYDYIVGAELTDGGQIKSFTFVKLQSPCEIVK